MNHIQKFWRHVLWLSVIIVPIPAGAFAVHTPDSLLACFLSYTLLALLVPFFYFSFQRSGYGAEWGSLRRGPHLVLTLSVLTVFWMALWFFIGREEALWKSIGMIPGTALFAVVLIAVNGVILRLDTAALVLYEKIRAAHGEAARWLALCFFTGFLPGTAVLMLLFFSLTRLDGGMVFVLYLSEGLTWILWLKIILAMMGIVFYLYFTLPGTRLTRMIQVVFTAFFWLICLYLPLVISLRIAGMSAWRVYADPAYLAIAPYLSDLWMTGIAYWAGRKVTAWICAAADKH